VGRRIHRYQNNISNNDEGKCSDAATECFIALLVGDRSLSLCSSAARCPGGQSLGEHLFGGLNEEFCGQAD
jgi:hypothetical protein